MKEQMLYSNLFNDVLSAGATIFINSLVVSEYINANLRIEYDRWKRRPENIINNEYKKYFRPSKDYISSQVTACAEVREILKMAEKKPDDFNVFELSEIYLNNKLDYNDAYYVWYCDKNRLIFVSDDKDVLDTPIDVRILTI